MTDCRHFVSISTPPLEEIRQHVGLAQTEEAAGPDDIPIERIRLNFMFQSEDGRTVFQLATLPSSFDEETLTALVLHLFMDQEEIVPEKDTFVRILIKSDEDGHVTASIPESELTLFSLE